MQIEVGEDQPAGAYDLALKLRTKRILPTFAPIATFARGAHMTIHTRGRDPALIELLVVLQSSAC